jgi:hypothetical protein
VQQVQEAERLFGRGAAAAQGYSHWENRRRMVVHYVMTHPATVRLFLGLFGLARDSSPLFFALERGWQMASGREMFTGQEVSRLGAAAEFFTMLAAGVATGRLMSAVRPTPPEGVRPPSAPLRSGLEREARPPDAMGQVIPLNRARTLRGPPSAIPEPIAAVDQTPLKATGTDGHPGPTRQDTPGNGPEVASLESPVRTGAGAASFESLVDVALGETREVLAAKFAVEESSAPGVRLPENVEAVRQAKPSLERPRPGVPPDSVRWREYVAYYEKRLAEMEAAGKASQPRSVKPPYDWPGYQTVRDNFARGIQYQRTRVAALRAEAKLTGFSKPHIQSNAGVLKNDLRYADALVIETDPGKPLRVETYSFKSRGFQRVNADEARAQLMADARDATKHYGGEIDIRTPGLGMRGKPVKVDKVHLVYDGDFRPLDPKAWGTLQNLVKGVAGETGVEVRFE